MDYTQYLQPYKLSHEANCLMTHDQVKYQLIYHHLLDQKGDVDL